MDTVKQLVRHRLAQLEGVWGRGGGLGHANDVSRNVDRIAQANMLFSKWFACANQRQPGADLVAQVKAALEEDPTLLRGLLWETARMVQEVASYARAHPEGAGKEIWHGIRELRAAVQGQLYDLFD
jgi:hypothetical protein